MRNIIVFMLGILISIALLVGTVIMVVRTKEMQREIDAQQEKVAETAVATELLRTCQQYDGAWTMLSDTKAHYYMLKGMLQELTPKELQIVNDVKAKIKEMVDTHKDAATTALALALLEIDIYGEMKV